MEGYKDPFNRRTYPWGRENQDLLEHFSKLGQLKKLPALKLGEIEFLQAGQGKLVFTRSAEGQTVKIYVNHTAASWEIPAGNVLYGKHLHSIAPQWLRLDSMGFAIIQF